MNKFAKGQQVRITQDMGLVKAGMVGFIDHYDADSFDRDRPLLYIPGWEHGHDGITTNYREGTTSFYFVREKYLKAVAPQLPAPKKAVKARVYGVKKDGTLSPQTTKVRDLLVSKGSITPVEAAAVYRVRSLTRRISDLKAAGYKISRVFNKDATGQRYARYYLQSSAISA
jgi:hypothetical protein